MSSADPLTTPQRGPRSLVATTYPPPPNGKCSMILLYEAAMMRTVSAVRAARKTARYWCSPSALKASSGPYDDDDSPSAPSPTQARNAASEMCWKRCGSWMSLGPPKSARLNRCHRVGGSGGSGSGCGGGGLEGAGGGAGWSMGGTAVLA